MNPQKIVTLAAGGAGGRKSYGRGVWWVSPLTIPPARSLWRRAKHAMEVHAKALAIALDTRLVFLWSCVIYCEMESYNFFAFLLLL